MDGVSTTGGMAHIYGLCDPITQQLRYVGKTNDPKKRLQAHLRCREKEKSYLTNWIKSLKAAGRKPEIFVIEDIPEAEWQEAEQFWISYFRAIGANLVNMLPGGMGGAVRGREITEETRKKISAALSGEKHFNYGKPSPKRGIPVSPEQIAKMRAANLGRPAHNKGKKATEETRRKLSEAHKGHPSNMTPETEARRIEAVRAACKGKPLSEEHKAKMRAAKRKTRESRIKEGV